MFLNFVQLNFLLETIGGLGFYFASTFKRNEDMHFPKNLLFLM